MLTLIIFGGAVCAQAPPAQAPSTPVPPEEPALVFRTGAAFVRVDVQVLDKGRPVPGLTADDFVVFDNGKRQPVETFARESEVLQVLFVLDVSGSMGRILAAMASVAERALDALNPGDEVGVMLYSRNALLSQELTTERRPAVLALRDAPLERDLGAGTSLNEALLEAAAYFRTLPPARGRRALVVLSDNGGINEKTPDDTVLRALAEVNVVLNAIVSKDARPPEPPPPGVTLNPDFTPSDIFRLAVESGGEVLRADKPERLREMLDHIRLRYSLGYRAPASEPGAWRSLRVAFSPGAENRLRRAAILARPGYFAAP